MDLKVKESDNLDVYHVQYYNKESKGNLKNNHGMIVSKKEIHQ